MRTDAFRAQPTLVEIRGRVRFYGLLPPRCAGFCHSRHRETRSFQVARRHASRACVQQICDLTRARCESLTRAATWAGTRAALATRHVTLTKSRQEKRGKVYSAIPQLPRLLLVLLPPPRTTAARAAVSVPLRPGLAWPAPLAVVVVVVDDIRRSLLACGGGISQERTRQVEIYAKRNLRAGASGRTKLRVYEANAASQFAW